MSNEYAIKIEKLSYQYVDSRPLIKELSLIVPENTIVTILGRNGAGKTTLLNCILGFIQGYTGKILLYGKPLIEFSRKELAKIVGLVPQLSQVEFDYTVEEFVLMGCAPTMGYFSVPDKEMYNAVDASLQTLGIEHLKYRLVNSLSGGERQLVYIARTLTQKPKIIVLDEPTSALDFGNSLKITDLILKLKEAGYTVLLTCHNPDYPFILQGYTIAMLPENKVLFGESEQILTDDVLTDLYGVRIKRVFLQEQNQYVCVSNKCKE